MANVSKEVVPDQLWSTIDSPRAIQTSIWANRSNFSINQNHPRHLWPKLRKSKILTFFEIGQVTMTPRGSIGNFNFWPFWPKLWDTIWIRLFEAKDGIIKVERWPSLTVGAELFLSLYRVKAKWSVGWSVANVSKEVVPDQLWSTIDSPRAIQTSIWANRNNFSINQNHPRHLWPKFKKSNILTFLKSVKWLWPPEAQLATSTFDLFDQNCKILYGLGCLGQKMA